MLNNKSKDWLLVIAVIVIFMAIVRSCFTGAPSNSGKYFSLPGEKKLGEDVKKQIVYFSLGSKTYLRYRQGDSWYIVEIDKKSVPYYLNFTEDSKDKK